MTECGEGIGETILPLAPTALGGSRNDGNQTEYVSIIKGRPRKAAEVHPHRGRRKGRRRGTGAAQVEMYTKHVHIKEHVTHPEPFPYGSDIRNNGKHRCTRTDEPIPHLTVPTVNAYTFHAGQRTSRSVEEPPGLGFQSISCTLKFAREYGHFFLRPVPNSRAYPTRGCCWIIGVQMWL